MSVVEDTVIKLTPMGFFQGCNHFASLMTKMKNPKKLLILEKSTGTSAI
jgi:hypothetical protein